MPTLRVTLAQQSPISLDVSFACKAGEVLALVGPSGSGKTTILRCIAGLYEPDGGVVQVGESRWFDSGQSIHLTPQARRVGFVFQDYALFPHLTVLENIAIALPNDQTAASRQNMAEDYLERVGLGGLGARYPNALSGGQQQRVALARALAREPDVLLLDEPFSAVDQVTRRKLRAEMAEITRHLNIPIILVTHDLEEACTLANRICVLHGGQSLQVGEPQEVLRQPISAKVAKVVDVRNVFSAEVIAVDAEANLLLLQWGAYALEAKYQPNIQVGDQVFWCIQPADLLLHQRVRPSNGERENPISGRLESVITMGGVSGFTVAVPKADSMLYLDLPPHVVRRNALVVGDTVGVSVLKTMLHVMRT